MELYRTVRQQAEASQIIEKSRFTAHVKPVETREEADAFISEIKGQYKDATHNVPAIVLGDKMQIQWASDDGEPQGTSGAPIVQMLVSEGITNIAVVVTRYFGGIKLGTGGLVRAYTSSAKLGLEEAGLCSVREVSRITSVIDYTFLAKFTQMASDSLGGISEEKGSAEYIIENVEYGEKVSLHIITSVENEENIKSLIGNISSGKAEIVEIQRGTEKV